MWVEYILIAITILVVVAYLYFFTNSRITAESARIVYGQVPTPTDLKGETGPTGPNGTITKLPETELDYIRLRNKRKVENWNNFIEKCITYVFPVLLVLTWIVGFWIYGPMISAILLAVAVGLAVVYYQQVYPETEAETPPPTFSEYVQAVMSGPGYLVIGVLVFVGFLFAFSTYKSYQLSPGTLKARLATIQEEVTSLSRPRQPASVVEEEYSISFKEGFMMFVVFVVMFVAALVLAASKTPPSTGSKTP